MSSAAVTLTKVKLIWFMHVGYFVNGCIYIHDKHFTNPKMTLRASFKSLKSKKSLYNPGDLENKSKVLGINIKSVS